jgi:hypothetical protein
MAGGVIRDIWFSDAGIVSIDQLDRRSFPTLALGYGKTKIIVDFSERIVARI